MSKILKKNLELIVEYNAPLVKRIIDHKDLDKDLQVIEAKSGDPNILYNGDYVHDNNDPVYEAIDTYQKIAPEDSPDTVHIIYGLGLGYLLKRFALKCSGKIAVVEPNLDVLRVVLEVVDFSDEFARKNIKLAGNNEELTMCLGKISFNLSQKVTLSSTMFYYKNYMNELSSIEAGAKVLNKDRTLIDQPCKINIGAGAWNKDGWLTLDCYIKADVQVDLRTFTPLPIVNDVVEKVFSSHCIEHIEDPHLEFLLKELYRIMKPGAIVRLACPDAEGALEAYRNNNPDWFNGIGTRRKDPIGARLLNTFVSYEARSGGPQKSEEEVREKFETLSKEDFIKWCLSLCDRSRPYIAHINGIYYDKLQKMMQDAGFVDIERSSYRNSRDEELKGEDFDLHPTVSLFVEAFKPV